MIKIPQKNFGNIRSLGSFLAALTISVYLVTQPIAAQTIQREPLPEPPPRLPSVSEYSLPPGEDSSSNDNRAEGPVEEDASPPEPITSTGSEEQITSSPSAEIVAPSVNNPPPSSNSSSTRRSNPTSNDRPVPARPSPNLARPSEPPAQLPNTGTRAPEPGFSFGLPENDNAESVDAQQSAPAEQDATTTATDSDSSFPFLYGLLAVILTVLATGLVIWRKRKIAAQPVDELQPQPSVDKQQRTPRKPAPRKSAPKIFSSPDPAGETKTPSSNSGGFVTTNLGVQRKAESSASNVENFGSARPRRWNHLDLNFAVESAASTLINAVVKYTVTLTNNSGETLTGLELSGALMQANETSTTGSFPVDGPILHQVTSLQPGETSIWSGEIRLPLNVIKPIRVKTRALFIPMARFSIQYRDQDSVSHEQNAAFVIGQEHEPPRPKMAPFRLDLGPRIFAPIGHRPLLTSR